MRLLLLERDESQITCLKEFLEWDLGHTTDIARTTTVARSLLSLNNYNLLIIDHATFWYFSDQTFVDMIKNKNVLVVTSWHSIEKDFKDISHYEVLKKPYNIIDLENKIELFSDYGNINYKQRGNQYEEWQDR